MASRVPRAGAPDALEASASRSRAEADVFTSREEVELEENGGGMGIGVGLAVGPLVELAAAEVKCGASTDSTV